MKYTFKDITSSLTKKKNSRSSLCTMGVGTIMNARKVLLIASGADKAEIIKKSFFGPVTPEVPASILQMHPDFTLVCDEAALSLV